MTVVTVSFPTVSPLLFEARRPPKAPLYVYISIYIYIYIHIYRSAHTSVGGHRDSGDSVFPHGRDAVGSPVDIDLLPDAGVRVWKSVFLVQESGLRIPF